jgi:hypothetical protein
MEDKSYSFRGYYPKEAVKSLEKLLLSKAFRKAIDAKTPKMSHVFRIAVSMGLYELEVKYGLRKPESENSSN